MSEYDIKTDNGINAVMVKIKKQWKEDLLSSVGEKDLHTNNGDIRQDAQWRAGWNACLAVLRSRAEEDK